MTKFDVPAPAAEQGNPYLPPGPPDPLMFDQIVGINTAASRLGVDEHRAYWLDGWMPIGPNNLRTLPDVGPSIWTPGGGAFISFFDFGNIGPTAIMIGFLADGSVWQVNTSTLAATQIAPPGTIINSSRANTGLSQFGSQYIIIVSKQTNGFFLWDGTIFYSPGGLAPGVTVTAGGSNYTSPTAVITGGSGSGAVLSVTQFGGVVTSITIVNPGRGYLATDTISVVISDGAGGSGATATASLMPLGISGTAVETYSQRVWVANGPIVFYTAPGTVSNFSTNGAGNFTSSASYLRVNYIALKATNGFLYLIGDSSVDYISGVQTNSNITTFAQQNADPEVGTPWPASVTTFGRNILFANAFGAQVSYGAAVTKISQALDGVYASVPNFGGLVPSSAKTIVYGRKLWVLLLPIIDPVSENTVNKLFLWDSKEWFSSPQSIQFLYVQHQEINSVITAYGTDGTSVYPLFQNPSAGFTKTIQTKFWPTPGYQFVKASTRLWGILYYYSVLSPNLTIDIDTENTTAAYTINIGAPTLTWKNNVANPLTWTNANGVLTWARTGLSVIPPTAIGQQGVLLGMTISTQAADMAIQSLMINEDPVTYRG